MALGCVQFPLARLDDLSGRAAPMLIFAYGVPIGAWTSALGLWFFATLLWIGGRAVGGSPSLEMEPWLDPDGPAWRFVRVALPVVQLVLALAALVLTYEFVGVAHGFSAWKVIWARVAGLILVVVPCVVVACFLID